MTINDIIILNKSIDLTYAKSSIIEKVDNIECIAKSIYIDYLDELKANMVEVTLSDDEYFKYRFKPKVLAHDIYKEKEFYFIIYLLNDISCDKDFDTRKVNLIPPNKFNVVAKIFNAESRFITMFNNGGYDSIESLPTALLDNDILTSSGLPSMSEIDMETRTLRYELDNIKRLIRDIIKQTIDESTSSIINNTIIEKIKEIDTRLKELISSEIKEILNTSQLLEKIKILEEENNKILKLIEKINEENVSSKIERLETTINNLKEKIALLDNNLDRLSNNTFQEQINKLTQDFNEFKESISELIKNQKNADIEKIKKDIEEIKEKLGSPAEMTKDIVLQVQAPVHYGPQKETEFFVLYDGVLEKVVMAVTADTELNSNLIMNLQKFVEADNEWVHVKKYELHSSDRFRIFDSKERLSKEYIRLALEVGNYEKCKGLTVVLRVRENRE